MRCGDIVDTVVAVYASKGSPCVHAHSCLPSMSHRVTTAPLLHAVKENYHITLANDLQSNL